MDEICCVCDCNTRGVSRYSPRDIFADKSKTCYKYICKNCLDYLQAPERLNPYDCDTKNCKNENRFHTTLFDEYHVKLCMTCYDSYKADLDMADKHRSELKNEADKNYENFKTKKMSGINIRPRR